MLGITTATRLNVRSKPDGNSSKRGFLPKGTVIAITGQIDNWFEIKYQDFPAYLSSLYVTPFTGNSHFSARVTANLLNVRSDPSVRSAIIGQLPKSAAVTVVALHPDWVEIEFNDRVAFIARDHVELDGVDKLTQGMVTARALNVRGSPHRDGALLGRLSRNARISIRGRSGEWLQIFFNGQVGYVHSTYITEQTQSESGSFGSELPQEPEPSPSLVTAHISPREPTLLAPARQLPLTGDSVSIKVSRTWNKYGALLQTLCEEITIDVASAVAVLCVESSGEGFSASNNDRMIIRFENHKFWKYWGKLNQQQFKRHFVYNSSKVWTGHQWRPDSDDPWQKFHGNQVEEWRVLEFARTLSNDAALMSISMGAPQIMGFHYQRIGYPTAEAMFSDFSQNIEAHIKGLFAFFDTAMINALKSSDFETFAGRYNGSGQKEKYGRWIRDHHKAFSSLAFNHSLLN
jgi:uncharacterized protein YgiM (DUF1202 family)